MGFWGLDILGTFFAVRPGVLFWGLMVRCSAVWGFGALGLRELWVWVLLLAFNRLGVGLGNRNLGLRDSESRLLGFYE